MDLMKSSSRIPVVLLVLCWLLALTRADGGTLGQDDGGMRLPDGTRVEKVKFGRSEVKLSGTLLVPRAPAGKRVPAVLFIPGSDQGARGEISIARAPQAAFRDLAATLAGTGIAALRYDSRCSGASDCSAARTPNEYAEDAVDALAYLRRRSEVDPVRVVLIGHDEGATFAAGVAANAIAKEKLAGLIMIAGPGRSYGKILRDQAQKRLAQAGRSGAEINDYVSKFDRIADRLSAGNIDLASEKIDPKDPLFALLVRNRDYFFHAFINDPLQVIRGVEVPVLIVQGEKDAQIGVRDAQYLAETLKRQYHGDATMQLLPEMDHWLRRPKAAGGFQEEERESDPMDPALIQLLTDWVKKVTR